MKQDFEILFDNGGGVLLMTPDYCHSYERAEWAADDVFAMMEGGESPADWEGNEPENRRERHSEDIVVTRADAELILNGSPARRNGSSYTEFCALLAHLGKVVWA